MRDYPPNLFQLSFPLNEDGTRQLCQPCCNPSRRPGSDEPQGDAMARLRYEFAVLPAPLLPRFLVRTFSLIQPERPWQRGVCCAIRTSGAGVDDGGGKVSLRHRSRAEGRPRDLLSIIRGTLMELFGEYKELHVTEQQWFDGQWVSRPTLERFRVLEHEWAEEPSDEEEAKP